MFINDDIAPLENLAQGLDPEPTLPPAAPPSLFSLNDRSLLKKRKPALPISPRTTLKYSTCSPTLILKGESEIAWLRLLSRWCETYHIPEPPENEDEPDPENTLLYDFVLRTAQADWHRLRCQRNYDNYAAILNGRSPYNWSPDEDKMHDRILRYKNGAERSFNRENRALEQFHKLHHSQPVAPASKANPKPAEPPIETATGLTLVAEDPTSPTGYSILKQIENGREIFENRDKPFTPPDPLPPNWRKFHYPPTKPDPAP